MYNLLIIKEKCPRCGVIERTEAEFKMGYMNLDSYNLGDEIRWASGQCKPPHQKRPSGGNATGEGYVCCPCCGKDFWLIIIVQHDVILQVEVDYTKNGYIE
ncbi:hypothetical protein C7R94_05180 [Brevibacillus sp. NRRL NRS-603]|nr:hypothetical protein C7R94_05180 [Brevibacillus sp. NRRL NRS-603]